MTLEILTADLLTPFQHGFFTRRGGASSGVFEGLNCGLGSTDQREAVLLNRQRVAEAMDVPEQALMAVHQIHSPDVVTVQTAGDTRPKADAMVTRERGIALSILTADCQPVLFADPHAQVVGAAHAGWRGTLDGVLEATVNAMVDLGARASDIVAVIGPSISQRAYEVGPEFVEGFISQSAEYEQFFTQGTDDRHLFNLPALGLEKLRSAGVGAAHWINHCTYSDPSRFYSFRRATHAKEADYGRLISCIRL